MDFIDSATGITLTPSYQGKKCQGNGEHPGVECCCDQCDYYPTCFPPPYYGDRRDFWKPEVRDSFCYECKHYDEKKDKFGRHFCFKTKRPGKQRRAHRCLYFEEKERDPYSDPVVDQIFADAMQRMAAEEGNRLIAENERLKNDPDAALPEDLYRKCMEILGG